MSLMTKMECDSAKEVVRKERRESIHLASYSKEGWDREEEEEEEEEVVGVEVEEEEEEGGRSV